MTEWLMSANSQKYNHQLAFQEKRVTCIGDKLENL